MVNDSDLFFAGDMTYSVYEKAEEKGRYFRVGPLYTVLRKAKSDYPESFTPTYMELFCLHR